MALNRQQLAKILELLGSAHDGEALAAARRAHMLVRNSNETWETLLAPRSSPAATATAATERPRTASPHGRELTSYEMLYALLHNNRTPTLIKKRLKPLEAMVVDGDVAEEVLLELRNLFKRYVVASADA